MHLGYPNYGFQMFKFSKFIALRLVFLIQDEKEKWMWIKPPPVSRKQANSENQDDTRKKRKVRRTHASSMRDRLLKGIVSSVPLSNH